MNKKLCEIVDIVANNEDCVVLKVQDNVEMDLITLGYFNGNEKMFRITKGSEHVATIFRGDSNFSWKWGASGYTLVSDEIRKAGQLIQECVEDEFGIYIGNDKQRVKDDLYIKSLNDKKGKECSIKILYYQGKEHEMCNIHKNNEHARWFDNVGSARSYIGERFQIKNQEQSIGITGCIVEEYLCLYN